MRPLFYIWIWLIYMIVILDYSSSLRILENNEVEIHSIFYGQYQHDPDKNILSGPEIYDRQSGEELCTLIANHLYGDADCNIVVRTIITVASPDIENEPFTLAGQKCECYDTINNQKLHEFCIRRDIDSRWIESFVLRPHVLPGEQLPLQIYGNTPLYPNAFFVRNGHGSTLYYDTAPVNVIYRMYG